MSKLKVAICGPNLRDQSKGQFHVHAAGCADLKHYGRHGNKYGGETPWEVEVESQWAATNEIYADHISDYGYDHGSPDHIRYVAENVSDLHFFPCTKGLREGVPTSLDAAGRPVWGPTPIEDQPDEEDNDADPFLTRGSRGEQEPDEEIGATVLEFPERRGDPAPEDEIIEESVAAVAASAKRLPGSTDDKGTKYEIRELCTRLRLALRQLDYALLHDDNEQLEEFAVEVSGVGSMIQNSVTVRLGREES